MGMTHTGSEKDIRVTRPFKMAAIGSKVHSAGNLDDLTNEDQEESLWASILNEVQSSSTVKLPVGKSLLILGDNETGKTTLIAKIQGDDDPKKGCGLEYHYIDVKDDYIDDQTRLSIWTLDGDPDHTGLLRHALTEDSFPHTLVTIVVSMTSPWTIIDSLKKWTTILADHVDRLRIPYDELQEYKQSLIRQFQEYVEPESEAIPVTSPPKRVSNPLHPSTNVPNDTDAVLLPLGETTLSNSLGIPIIVVVTKSDAISTLEKESDYRDEHFDFIQLTIRKFCLNYGAALFYTSVKEEKNCELLYKYILHRIYGFPFHVPAFVVDRDSIFIPSGWDNENKISILCESMTSIQSHDTYDDVIVRPSTRKVMRDAEVTAEEEQSFLAKQQIVLGKAPAHVGSRQDSPMRPSSGQKGSIGSPRSVPSPGSITGSPKKVGDKAPGGANQEGVLASFFNSLLSKRTGVVGAAGPGAKPDKAAVTRDAAAELDRMTRAKKPSSTSSPNRPEAS